MCDCGKEPSHGVYVEGRHVIAKLCAGCFARHEKAVRNRIRERSEAYV